MVAEVDLLLAGGGIDTLEEDRGIVLVVDVLQLAPVLVEEVEHVDDVQGDLQAVVLQAGDGDVLGQAGVEGVVPGLAAGVALDDGAAGGGQGRVAVDIGVQVVPGGGLVGQDDALVSRP